MEQCDYTDNVCSEARFSRCTFYEAFQHCLTRKTGIFGTLLLKDVAQIDIGQFWFLYILILLQYWVT